MDAETIVFVSLFSAASGAVTALGILQAVSGRLIFRRFAGRDWTSGEIKVSGWSWVICGVAGIAMSLVGGLEFGARVIPMYWVGSPWGLITGNPWPLIALANLLFQLLIELRHKRQSRISR
jgi:hypothetical protein